MTTKVELNPAVKEQVDRMIADQYTDRSIVKALDSIGVKISQPTINRYRNSEQAPSAIEHDNPELPDDVTIKNDLGLDTGKVLDEFETSKHSGLAREKMLETIVNNQLAIVISEQRRFIAGESKYPFEGVKALKDLLAVFDSTRLKVSSQKEIDQLLQDEKVERIIRRYYNQGLKDYKNDIEVDLMNIRVNVSELVALNLPNDRFKKAETDMEAAYIDGYRQAAINDGGMG